MKTDLSIAKELLLSKNYTCVLCKDDKVHISKERGVKPLLDWFDKKADLKNFSAADKVVGKGAAFLYTLLGVKEIYACVISESANEVLEKFGIRVYFDECVKAILNRSKTGFCPIETSVKNIDEPEKAVPIIRETLFSLNKKD